MSFDDIHIYRKAHLVMSKQLITISRACWRNHLDLYCSQQR
jgi:hypothetical protein